MSVESETHRCTRELHERLARIHFPHTNMERQSDDELLYYAVSSLNMLEERVKHLEELFSKYENKE